MSKKIKNYLLAVLTFIAIFCIIYPLVFWIRNPELTYMQIIFEIWWDIPLGICCAVLVYKLID